MKGKNQLVYMYTLVHFMLADESLAYWKDGDKEGMMNMGKDTFTKEELKEALKKFKANRDDVQDPEKVKSEYR